MARLPVRLMKSTDIANAYPMELVANEATGDLYLITSSGDTIDIKNIVAKTTILQDSKSNVLATIEVETEKIYILPDVTTTNPGLATPEILANIASLTTGQTDTSGALEALGVALNLTISTAVTGLQTELTNHASIASTTGQFGHVVLANSIPAVPTTGGAVGIDSTVARADHSHPAQALPAASSILPAGPGTAAVGGSAEYARADHIHQAQWVPAASNAAPAYPSNAWSGGSAEYARADHVHPAQAAATTVTYNVVIGTAWEGGAAPFVMSVGVGGILYADNPIVDVMLSADYATALIEMEQYGNIYKIVSFDGYITLYSLGRTTANITIQLKCIR